MAQNVETFTRKSRPLEDHDHLTLEEKRAVIERVLMSNAAMEHPVFGVAGIREHAGADTEVFVINAVGADGVTPASVVRYMVDLADFKAGKALMFRPPNANDPSRGDEDDGVGDGT